MIETKIKNGKDIASISAARYFLVFKIVPPHD
jgi:hypothetical protein